MRVGVNSSEVNHSWIVGAREKKRWGAPRPQTSRGQFMEAAIFRPIRPPFQIVRYSIKKAR